MTVAENGIIKNYRDSIHIVFAGSIKKTDFGTFFSGTPENLAT